MNSRRTYVGLIVEDDELLAEIIKEEFERFDFEIHKALSGSSAKQIILSNPKIDFILTDIQMPEGNGRELIHWLNSEVKNCPPIYVYSGHHDIKESEMAELRIRKTYFKPHNIEIIISEILQFLTRPK